MKTTINKSQFRDEFMRMGRKDNFSYDGLGILFDYFEQYEEHTGEEIELDVIAICCEFCEETQDEIRANYDAPSDKDLITFLEQNTYVVGVTDDGSIIYQAF
jgi:hypothetical protein